MLRLFTNNISVVRKIALPAIVSRLFFNKQDLCLYIINEKKC